jgi:protein-arginine kinase activator protein McsA
LLNNNNSLDIVCNECGTSFNDLLNTGKMGCANCYKIFRKKLIPILKRIQGGTEYLGGTAGNVSNDITEDTKLKNNDSNIEIENKIKSLENNLKKCIQEENYEEAAKIRDEIKNEKAKIDKNKIANEEKKNEKDYINKKETDKSNENIKEDINHNKDDINNDDNSNQDKGGNN